MRKMHASGSIWLSGYHKVHETDKQVLENVEADGVDVEISSSKRRRRTLQQGCANSPRKTVGGPPAVNAASHWLGTHTFSLSSDHSRSQHLLSGCCSSARFESLECAY